MKKNYGSILIVGLLFIGAISCTKDGPTFNEQNNLLEEGILSIDIDESLKLYYEAISANEVRLKQLGLSSRSCINDVNVPGDVLSIQAAVDAVCAGGSISVTSGTYTENVVVNKPGITISGSGEMQLNGSITLSPDAHNVTIQNFNIIVQGRLAISAVGVEKGNVLNNTITGTTPLAPLTRGIQYHTSKNVTIMGNHIHGLEYGIALATGGINGPGLSSHNMIRNNTITDVRVFGGILLQGNCDNNTIQNNSITDSPDQSFNAGIILINRELLFGENCDNNNIRNNISSGGVRGIWIGHLNNESNGGGNNNMVGPGNVFNGNAIYGILISDSNGNRIINNTALENGTCDIIQERCSNNFRNNTADCTEGI